MLINHIRQLLAPPCLLCGSMEGQIHNYCTACYQDLPHNLNACRLCALPLDAPDPLSHEYVSGLSQVAYPKATGSKIASQDLCHACQQARWHNPNYLGGVDHCLAAMYYLPPVSRMMHSFKNQGRKDCGHLLSHCLSRYVTTQLLHKYDQDVTWPRPDVLIPMPLHPQKIRQRGFNQSYYIAQILSKRLHIKVDNELCWRLHDTPSQQGKKRYQRQHNLHRAFMARPLTYPAKHLVIIDDVMTTGASISNLALALQQVQHTPVMISAWCVERTLPPNSPLQRHLK